MSDSNWKLRQPTRLSLLPAVVALAGAVGVVLYGLSVGQRMEATAGLRGVSRLWWFSVASVVLGIVVATIATARRATGPAPRDVHASDEFERNKAATLRRLSVLVASASLPSAPPPTQTTSPADLRDTQSSGSLETGISTRSHS